MLKSMANFIGAPLMRRILKIVAESGSSDQARGLYDLGSTGDKTLKAPLIANDSEVSGSGSTLTGKKHSRDQSNDDDTALQSNSQNSKQSRRVSFGRNLTLEDLKTPGNSSPNDGDVRNNLMPKNLQSSVGSSLPSTDDPDDASYCTDQDLRESTSKLFTWNYLEGSGRLDSHVDNAWMINDIEVGRDLMDFRDRVVQENGGLTKPYEKLAVNFILLVEAEYQTGGLQGQVEDQTWESLCNAVKDTVLPLSDEVITEAHRWAHRLAQNNSEAFFQLLDDSPPQNRTLMSILTKMADTAQLWNTQMRNEDTYLKSQLGPFLDTFIGRVKYTKSDWTPVQDDTRGSESSLLIPDYATTTQVGEQQLFIMLLEGKIARNTGIGQNWDGQTKLGQEMKAALDSILKLEPDNEVCVIGLLIREPLVEFYTMQVHAEATYVMHKFATSYISPDAMNAFPLVHLLEVFAHAKVKVEKTVAQIRQVKVHASSTPKVPLSWLRPSFRKPKLCLVVDGQ
ncbi:hypothetical protein BGZ76_004431 [Entomortierella beljakovae]|nr:hypothetical protein BGZ76_004431 [Entomortierella beljakovae]